MFTLTKAYIKQFALLTGLLLLVVYLSQIFWEEGVQAYYQLKTIPFSFYIVILGSIFVSYIIRFKRWSSYIYALSHIKLPFFRHILYYMAGFAFILAPAKVGEGVRALYLKKHDVEINKSLSVLLVERLQDVMILVLFSSLIVLLDPHYIWVISLTFLVMTVLVFLLQRDVFLKWLHVLSRYLPKSLTFMEKMLTSCRELMRGWKITFGLITSAFAWGIEGLCFYFTLQYLGVDISPWLSVGIFAISILVGVLSFMPGGLGGTEATMLSLLLLLNVPLDIALAATAVCRFTTLWFAIILGLISLFFLHLGKKKEVDTTCLTQTKE